MAATPIRFFFDYISPYAYLAWTQLPTLAARHGRTLEPVPVLFAAVLNALGTRGPAEVPPKRVYLFKQTCRIAHGFKVPFTPPPAHPFNPLLALRVTEAVTDPAARQRLVSALYSASWGDGSGVEGPERVGAVLASVGLEAKALLAAAQTPGIKDGIRRNTEELLALGGFGVPSYTADGELFFGVDSLGHFEQFLRGEDPLRPADLERWKNLPASASRT
ncbi:MAG TPA: 2-hydroxychromene-2-carboxylate isomerase [Myxococcaceae bacterium]|jgi:2-hydroxychromene-2-carboxylate isomerase